MGVVEAAERGKLKVKIGLIKSDEDYRFGYKLKVDATIQVQKVANLSTLNREYEVLYCFLY